MALMTCERCGEQTAKIETCSYCGKNICRNCIKSSKRVKKITRLFICKTCWGDIKKRKEFLSA